MLLTRVLHAWMDTEVLLGHIVVHTTASFAGRGAFATLNISCFCDVATATKVEIGNSFESAYLKKEAREGRETTSICTYKLPAGTRQRIKSS